MIDNLLCISPIDGRYHNYTKQLNHYFSEFALFKYRKSDNIKNILMSFLKLSIKMLKKIPDNYICKHHILCSNIIYNYKKFIFIFIFYILSSSSASQLSAP